jgi:hypothetical protein
MSCWVAVDALLSCTWKGVGCECSVPTALRVSRWRRGRSCEDRNPSYLDGQQGLQRARGPSRERGSAAARRRQTPGRLILRRPCVTRGAALAAVVRITYLTPHRVLADPCEYSCWETDARPSVSGGNGRYAPSYSRGGPLETFALVGVVYRSASGGLSKLYVLYAVYSIPSRPLVVCRQSPTTLPAARVSASSDLPIFLCLLSRPPPRTRRFLDCVAISQPFVPFRLPRSIPLQFGSLAIPVDPFSRVQLASS